MCLQSCTSTIEVQKIRADPIADETKGTLQRIAKVFYLATLKWKLTLINVKYGQFNIIPMDLVSGNKINGGTHG